MTRITNGEQVGRIGIGVDVAPSFLHAAPINVMNDQARTISATDATFVLIALNDSMCGRISAFARFVLAAFGETPGTRSTPSDGRTLATITTKPLLPPFGTYPSGALARTICTSLAKGLPFSWWGLAARMAKPALQNLIAPVAIALAYLGKALWATNIARIHWLNATSDTEPFGPKSCLAEFAARLGLINAFFTARLAGNWGVLSANDAQARSAKMREALSGRTSSYIKAWIAAGMALTSWPRAAMNTNAARLKGVPLLLVESHHASCKCLA